VCFAEIGHQVICIDNDERKVAALRGGDTLIHEEHLPELLSRYRNDRIRFTADLAEATRECDAIFIAVGTPQSEAGDADLSYVEAVACEIARSITKYTVIVEKSTVPVYTNEWIRRAMERNGVARQLFDVVSNPEFLREGTAVADFLHPYDQPQALEGICSASARPPLLQTSTKSAEIIKHASNAFLALKISFINAVSNLCEATDANVQQVAHGLGLDSRIGPKFLRPGIGYGGSCFPKDVAAFRSVADQLGVDFNLLTEVEKINAAQKIRFVRKVRSALWTLRGKKLGVLGLAFKGETDDIRDSPAIELVQLLIGEGCSIVAFDPAAMPRAQQVVPAGPQMRYAEDAYAAAGDADALLILTDWKEFGALDLKRLNGVMRYPIVIDGRNLFDPSVVAKHGLTYVSVGRPTAYPVRDELPEPVAVGSIA
jgi:UDPglucose 6-dehydrogenase